jgi:type VI secretion system FHA domain protein
MALRLKIISQHRQQLGPRSSIVFGVSGGSIGRALDNDWVLPDAQRYLSGHHARIHFRQGSYFLEDTSSNGVFINQATMPQGARGLYALRDGDILRLGEFRIQVILGTEQSQVPTLGATDSQLSMVNVVPLRAVGQANDDLGASLNIEALIPQDVDAALAKLGIMPEHSPAITIPSGLSAQQRLARLRAAARSRLEGSALPDVRNGMQAFCRGAGIDPTRLPMGNEAQSLHLIGRLLRETIIGLKEILRAQETLADHYGIDAARPEGRSPLELGADEYLLDLLVGHENHRFDAVMQLRNLFNAASQQTSALDPAVSVALTQFLSHLQPARLEASANAGGQTSDQWSRYKDLYKHLLQTSGKDVPHLFQEAIAQAFREALDKQRP